MALSTTQYGYIIDPMVPFTDDKGNTIKDGFVRVFVAGSSTPVITYRNFDGATNQDLIELDNSGRTKTSVIGSKGFTYKVCVYDAFHSQESPILTVDKVSVIGANITAGAGATLVTGLDGLTTKPDGFVDASVVGTDGYVALDHTLVTDDLDTDAKATAVEDDRYVPLLNKDVNDPDSKMILGRLWQWVLGKIKSLSTTITAFRTGDVIPVDGPSGPAKMSKDDLLRETAENTLSGNVAPMFDASKPNGTDGYAYHKGEKVIYNGKLYEFSVNAVSGAWDATLTHEIDISELLDEVNILSEDVNGNVDGIFVNAEFDSNDIVFNSNDLTDDYYDISIENQVDSQVQLINTDSSMVTLTFNSGNQWKHTNMHLPSIFSYAKIRYNDSPARVIVKSPSKVSYGLEQDVYGIATTADVTATYTTISGEYIGSGVQIASTPDYSRTTCIPVTKGQHVIFSAGTKYNPNNVAVAMTSASSVSVGDVLDTSNYQVFGVTWTMENFDYEVPYDGYVVVAWSDSFAPTSITIRTITIVHDGLFLHKYIECNEQSLTDKEKTTVRNNIGALGKNDVSGLEQDVYGVVTTADTTATYTAISGEYIGSGVQIASTPDYSRTTCIPVTKGQHVIFSAGTKYNPNNVAVAMTSASSVSVGDVLDTSNYQVFGVTWTMENFDYEVPYDGYVVVAWSDSFAPTSITIRTITIVHDGLLLHKYIECNEQSLTDKEKTTVRNNIGALGKNDVIPTMTPCLTILADDWGYTGGTIEAKHTQFKLLCDTLGVKATWAAIPDGNNTDGYSYVDHYALTYEEMQLQGFSFLVHPNHDYWRGYTDVPGMDRSTIGAVLAAREAGIENADFLVYPYGGGMNANSFKMAYKWCNGVGINAGYAPYYNEYGKNIVNLNRLFIDDISAANIDSYKTIVANAYAKNAWVILGLHPNRSDNDKLDLFKDLVNYAIGLGIRVATFQEAWNILRKNFK